jgi:type I restriction enzyme S subunit
LGLNSDWEEIKLKDLIELKTGKLNSNAAIDNGNYHFFTCSPEPLKINNYSFNQKAILLAGNNANGIFHINY